MSGSYYPPLQTPLRSSPSLSPHSTLCLLIFSFLSSHQSNLCCLYSPGCVAIRQSMVDIPGPTFLSAAVSCNSSSAGSGTLCPPPFSMLQFFSGLRLHRSCASCQNCCEFIICATALLCPDSFLIKVIKLKQYTIPVHSFN